MVNTESTTNIEEKNREKMRGRLKRERRGEKGKKEKNH
jgi:hypothetical protein